MRVPWRPPQNGATTYLGTVRNKSLGDHLLRLRRGSHCLPISKESVCDDSVNK